MKVRYRWSWICAVLVVAPLTLCAQGEVTGRVSIQEKPGETTTDIAGAVVYLIPKSGVPRLNEAKAQVTMDGRQFKPRVRVVTPGSTVDFPNTDPFSHNIFSTAPGAAFDLGTYGSGPGKSTQFKKAGTYPVYCNIHAKMTAWVVVVPTPFVTQPGNDGRFTVNNVPAGKYELHVWHERTNELVKDVDVAASGLTTDATLDGRGFKFVEHKNKFGKDYSSAVRY